MIWPVRRNQDDANPAGRFTRLEDPTPTVDQDRWGRNVNVQGGMNTGTGEDGIRLEEINEAHSGIQVKNEITVVSEAWDYKDRLY